MSKGVVLLAEDDEILRAFIAGRLREAGYVVSEAADGREALALGQRSIHDLLILDRDMPEIDGLDALRAIRRAQINTPVIFLTALDGVSERVRGLDAGADDYLVKPFEMDELMARMRALVRRPALVATALLSAGALSINLTAWRASFDGRDLDLTAQDVTLLAAFLKRPTYVYTRDALLDCLGASDDITPAAVEHAVSRLRKKLSAVGAPDPIETVRGVGYRLNLETLQD